MLRFFYIMASLYFTQLTLLKLTLIFFYIRVFPAAPVQRLLWGTVAFVVAWGFAFVIVAIFQCQPIHYFWNKWDGLHHGKCLQINAITASNAGISIALDLWILGIPLWQLWGLEDALEEEDWCSVNVCRGDVRHCRQHPASLRLSSLRRFVQRELGVLRRLSLVHHRNLRWNHVVSHQN